MGQSEGGNTMARDPVDRVLEHNMPAYERQPATKPYDPIFNPAPVANTADAVITYNPDQIDTKDFGRPATGDGE
ncbi:hypothetical protein K2P47_03010 [Patescibacteria group bacterium]|nr:hypothetical protein [Patescibacteria group bacterium]